MSALAAGSDVEIRVRAEIYAILARSVQYPRVRVNFGLLDHVRFEGGLLDSARSDVVEASMGSVQSLQAAHRVLFPAVESQDAPSYETAYSRHDVFRQSEVMADISGFYRAHGLNLGGHVKDRPDGIGPELEFMGFLAAKQAHARTSGLSDAEELCLDTQRSFLRDHLGRWGPDYGQRMAAVTCHAFYGALGRLLSAWISTDMDILNVEPLEADAIGGDASPDTVPIADPRVRWDDLSCGGIA
jgi:TorA maturation chaperone TorD